MKTILALILLATIAHSAVVEDDALDLPGVDIVLESINIEVDWAKLVACIKAAHPVVKDIIDLVKIIKAKNYDEAIAIVQRLLGEGNQLIKSCKGAIHKKNKVNLGTNWEKLLQCIMAAAKQYPQIKELIEAIKNKDYAAAMIILITISGEAKKIIKQCKA